MDDAPIRVSASGTITAPASAVWATVADFGAVADYLPSVVHCRLEGTGIIPDKTVIPTLTDVQNKRDPALAEADRTLAALAASNKRL